MTTDAIEATILNTCGCSNAVLDGKLQEVFTVLDDIGIIIVYYNAGDLFSLYFLQPNWKES